MGKPAFSMAAQWILSVMDVPIAVLSAMPVLLAVPAVPVVRGVLA
jgi:hypothetical protein